MEWDGMGWDGMRWNGVKREARNTEALKSVQAHQSPCNHIVVT